MGGPWPAVSSTVPPQLGHNSGAGSCMIIVPCGLTLPAVAPTAVTISHSIFIDNAGDAGGGALAALGNSSVTVKQCRFINNSMAGFGGNQRDRGARYSRPLFQEGGAVIVSDTARGMREYYANACRGSARHYLP